MVDFKVVSAIFRKDMRAYLGNPTGYVFITLFIMATGAAAFLQEEFFTRNLADLATLNAYMPAILMFFVPAITMNAWADERRGGTDELLLTLPLRDGEVVLGKYLGVLGMYTASLALTAIAQLSVLMYLGEPDKGLMFSTFAGYWLMGALFAAIGLVGSMLTLNTTVAFILGGLGCAGLVFTGTLPWASGILGVALLGLLVALCWWVVRGTATGAGLLGLGGAVLGAVLWQSRNFSESESGSGEAAAGATADAGAAAVEAAADLSTRFEQVFGSLSVSDHFASFGEGVMRLGDIVYFVGGVALMLYLCAFLLGRRHW
ncbi:MAG: ABC-2 transporter permease [Myxococcales bacterium]|nr:ABC-2 transporter permease [Myxococcales bacterium]